MTVKHETDPTRPNLCEGQPPEQALLIGIVSSQVMPANPRRVGVILSNFGPMRAWLAWDEDAELEKGFFLDSGAVWNFDAGLVAQGPLNAITKAATTSIAFQEMNRA